MTVRIQTGHYGRTTGATGAYNSRLNIGEAIQNNIIAREVERLSASSPLVWQFVGPDERRGLDGNPEIFISIHHDGSENPTAERPSVGHPPSSSTSAAFGEMWKRRYGQIPGALPFRENNYAGANMSRYYGWSTDHSGNAPVKALFEMEFITSDNRGPWAVANAHNFARAIVDTVHEYSGVTGESAPVSAVPETDSVADLRQTVDAQVAVNHSQRGRLIALRDKVDRLEAEAVTARQVNAQQRDTLARLRSTVTVLEGRISAMDRSSGAAEVADILERVANQLRASGPT